MLEIQLLKHAGAAKLNTVITLKIGLANPMADNNTSSNNAKPEGPTAMLLGTSWTPGESLAEALGSPCPSAEAVSQPLRMMLGCCCSDKRCQSLGTKNSSNSFCTREQHCSKSHKFSSKPVIMANGKEATGLVPGAAWESWAPSQLVLGPEGSRIKPCPSTVPQCHDAAQLCKPRELWACEQQTPVGLVQVYFSWAM